MVRFTYVFKYLCIYVSSYLELIEQWIIPSLAVGEQLTYLSLVVVAKNIIQRLAERLLLEGVGCAGLGAHALPHVQRGVDTDLQLNNDEQGNSNFTFLLFVLTKVFLILLSSYLY